MVKVESSKFRYSGGRRPSIYARFDELEELMEKLGEPWSP
jgi:hypothetical protein